MSSVPRLLGLPGRRGQRVETRAPRRLALGLAVARENEKFEIPGDFLIFASGPANTAVTIRPGSSTSDPIDLFRGDRIYLQFHELYITHAAGSGTIVLLVGGDEQFQLHPGGDTSAVSVSPPTTAFEAEVLALTASWTELFDFSSARGAQGVIFINNRGPNPVSIASVNTGAETDGQVILPGGSVSILNPGGQIWYVRATAANQVTTAAMTVNGFWTGA
jgi:hypothetical protein